LAIPYPIKPPPRQRVSSRGRFGRSWRGGRENLDAKNVHRPAPVVLRSQTLRIASATPFSRESTDGWLVRTHTHGGLVTAGSAGYGPLVGGSMRYYVQPLPWVRRVGILPPLRRRRQPLQVHAQEGPHPLPGAGACSCSPLVFGPRHPWVGFRRAWVGRRAEGRTAWSDPACALSIVTARAPLVLSSHSAVCLSQTRVLEEVETSDEAPFSTVVTKAIVTGASTCDTHWLPFPDGLYLDDSQVVTAMPTVRRPPATKPSPCLALCLPHCISLAVCLAPCLPLCLPHCVSHATTLTVAERISRRIATRAPLSAG
jgi:hypothetical protein